MLRKFESSVRFHAEVGTVWEKLWMLGFIFIQRRITKMLDFINLQHQNVEIIFCPDLATCHYVRTTRFWLEQNNVNDISTEDVSQSRPFLVITVSKCFRIRLAGPK